VFIFTGVDDKTSCQTNIDCKRAPLLTGKNKQIKYTIADKLPLTTLPRSHHRQLPGLAPEICTI